MNSSELRKKFLDYFEKNGHTVVPSSSLIPKDSSLLFTTAGMQQFKEYYLGKPSPFGENVCSVQKCIRTTDIDEVGDNTHLTFFEMLGNFSFGGYFKEEAIKYAHDFALNEISLPKERVYITYFKGDDEIPEDVESKKIWQDLGVAEENIFGFGRDDNFWGPTGDEGPCGPTTEIHYDLTGMPCGENCAPNCDCGRFVEIWNIVFNEFYKNKDGKFLKLERSGIDTGMGFERLLTILQNKNSVYETDVFLPIIEKLEDISNLKYNDFIKEFRIISDHIKASCFIIADGVLPSNVEKGYVLRRLIRRSIRFARNLKLEKNFFVPICEVIKNIYEKAYPEIGRNFNDILTVLEKESYKFNKTLEKGLKEFEKLILKGEFTGKHAFYLYETFGFPFELTRELLKEKNINISDEEFKKEFEKHKEISRAGAEKKFGGHGLKLGSPEIRVKDESEIQKVTRLHTATHLLHAALRKILGEKVRQMGSDITAERLRFDFSFDRKLTPEEIKKVEDLVNQKIKEGIDVIREEMPYGKAIKQGALAFFKEKYPDIVSVYSIGDFSKELCGGPHVKNTKEVGKFKIIKQESIGANIKRIKAVVE